MVKVEVYNMKSPEKSFSGFEIFKFLKGRRRGAIVLLSGLIAYFTNAPDLATLIAGMIIEGAIGATEFYFNKY